MAITVVGGFALVILSIVVSTVIDGNSFGPLIGPSSILLVVGCCIGASIIPFEVEDVRNLPKAIIKSLRSPQYDLNARIELYAELADLSRREGLLALEGQVDRTDDEFVRAVLQMVSDGVDGITLADEIEAWMAALDERHSIAPTILRKLAGYGPAFGMVGTVIGLINMLGNLSSPESLGAGMAVALLTTLYGSMLANLVFQPFAERLEKLHGMEMRMMQLDADGLKGIHAGVQPRLLVSHLETMLPPAERIGFDRRLGRVA